jgi:hypothetical protein
LGEKKEFPLDEGKWRNFERGKGGVLSLRLRNELLAFLVVGEDYA